MNQLKGIRETSCLDLNEISDHLGIPIRYLRAIEEEKFSQLPHKKLLVENCITSYASFLEIDAKPIIYTYRQSLIPDPSFAPRMKKQRSSLQWKPFLNKYRYYLLACVACISLSLVTWLIIPGQKGDPTKIRPTADNQTTSITINKERPIFKLQATKEDSGVGETWYISQTDNIQVLVQSLGVLSMEIREDSLKGNIMAKKELTKSESFDLSGKKWLFIHFDNPSNASLKINGVVINTATQKNATTYEFKIVSN